MAKRKTKNFIDNKSIFVELHSAIVGSNVDRLIALSTQIRTLSDKGTHGNLRSHYDNANNPIRTTNLIILACKYDRMEILNYLLDETVFERLYVEILNISVSPSDRDEEDHGAFYYAIRSGNTQLVDVLISKWASNYFTSHPNYLDGIISSAYEELKLRNVPVSEEMEIFIESKLINLRFFSSNKNCETNLRKIDNINIRIDLIIQNVKLLEVEYSGMKNVDAKFLFVAKFIAQNIHIVKRQLKSTYDRLPWEEIEFCVICFVLSYTTIQEINLFYRATLSKDKLLKYLKYFAQKLESESGAVNLSNLDQLARIPALKRDHVVGMIIKNSPQFEQLYRDYEQIRDIDSLVKISEYFEVMLKTDPKEREGQLIITRVLQVMGEHLKNTLEAPKLSTTTAELFLLSLSKNTRKVVINLRNALSHAYSLYIRLKIEDNIDVNFFITVHNDIKKIGNVTSDILYLSKIKMLGILLKKIADCDNLSEMREIMKILTNVKLDRTGSVKSQLAEHDKLQQLITELNASLPDKTMYEQELFNKIKKILNSAKSEPKKATMNYAMGFISLKSIYMAMQHSELDDNAVRVLKETAKTLLQKTASPLKSCDFTEIRKLIAKILESIDFKEEDSKSYTIYKTIVEIQTIIQFGIGSIKGMEKLRNMWSNTTRDNYVEKTRRMCTNTRIKPKFTLESKLSELKIILKNNKIDNVLLKKNYCHYSKKKFQILVETLVLDILSILGDSKGCLQNNPYFLDASVPLLIGKNLRNHLAHGDILHDILISNSSTATVINAEILTTVCLVGTKGKIGTAVKEDFVKLKEIYQRSLDIIEKQEKMFFTLEAGNLEDLKSCVAKGTDVNAHSINFWNALHYAAKGASLEIIKFLLKQNRNLNIEDVHGQNVLHIAATHGRAHIVEFFIEQRCKVIDDQDSFGRTSLHIAAEIGHKNVVEILLNHNADTSVKDTAGASPLHYAVQNNHIDIVKMLLQKEVHVDYNEKTGGYTALHLAAERGHSELVNFLLENRANVNARNDHGGIPLHTAALNGHLDVVKTLILKGADINARVMEGCTSLHYAAENGHESIIVELLNNGANVDVFDQVFRNTPLHYVVKDGYQNIVQILLHYNANPNIATVHGLTPLHLAAEAGHLTIVSSLVEQNVNVDARDITNTTPLYNAAKYGHKNIVELLLKSGADVNAKDFENNTALHVAALNGHKDVVCLLIKNKARINAQDMTGLTPLHSAAAGGNNDVINLLLKNKCEINAEATMGLTPLNLAIRNGHENAARLLLEYGSNINNEYHCDFTPLHVASMFGHKNIVGLLLERGANIEAKCSKGHTPLHLAVEAGKKEVIETLILNGADVRAKNNENIIPLEMAIRHNSAEIVKILMINGGYSNTDDHATFMLALFADCKEIIHMFLKNNALLNEVNTDYTPLHVAVMRGNTETVNTLIKRGATVDAAATDGTRPLHVAAHKGYEEIAEILIDSGADVNSQSNEGLTPLHKAAIGGCSDVLQILLDSKADWTIKDYKNRTALELAVAYGQLEIVQILLQCKDVDPNAKGNDGWTILHIAAQENNTKMIEHLIEAGCKIDAKNASGSKPFHIAAREGHLDTLRIFLNKGLNINDPGAANQTLLHYAALKDQTAVVKYVIAQGADVNIKDAKGSTAVHIAATSGSYDVVQTLLQNGAAYDAPNMFYLPPALVSANERILNLLKSTYDLFSGTKNNNCQVVQAQIKAGACVDSKNYNSKTPLHYAAWKGYEKIVDILLQNNANPNTVDTKGCAPLHYAAKFAHLNIAIALLSNGAIFDAVSDGGKTALNFATDKDIIDLLNLVSESFVKVKNNDARIINDLNKINSVPLVQAVLRARNRENQTLIITAIHTKFSKIAQLKEIMQGDIADRVNVGLMCCNAENYEKSLELLNWAYEQRKNILGPDNPGTLDIENHIALVLYKQGRYEEALNKLKNICQKREFILGPYDQDTLSSRSTIALILHRQGNNDDALIICKDVYQKQIEILGSDHEDTLATQLHMGLILDAQTKYDEALLINKDVFEKTKKVLGANNSKAIGAQNNIAMVLLHHGKHEEALEIYKEVLQKKIKTLGAYHTATLRTLHQMATILTAQKKYSEALEAHQQVWCIQKKILGHSHPETLITQYNLGNIFFNQCKWNSALKIYTECYAKMKTVFGLHHASIQDMSLKMKAINSEWQAYKPEDVIKCLQRNCNIAASNGDIETIARLLEDGANVNHRDTDGRTSLHYAVGKGQTDAVNMLLKYGADITIATNKGNTALHTAVFEGHHEITKILLQYARFNKLDNFINAKTSSSGTTALHVATKSGFREIVKILLQSGATYNLANKEGKICVDYSNDQIITNLLLLIEQLFLFAKSGNLKLIDEVEKLPLDDFKAVVNVRNNQKNTLLQVTIFNKHKHLTSLFLDLLRNKT